MKSFFFNHNFVRVFQFLRQRYVFEIYIFPRFHTKRTKFHYHFLFVSFMVWCKFYATSLWCLRLLGLVTRLAVICMLLIFLLVHLLRMFFLRKTTTNVSHFLEETFLLICISFLGCSLIPANYYILSTS